MTPVSSFHQLLERLRSGETLNAGDTCEIFTEIVSGNIDGPDVASLLTVLAERKPTVEEIVGAATALRRRMIRIKAPSEAIDLCGTGGDGLDTLNISTASAFVIAGTGIPVAKHGNRNMSSTCGAADVLEALGATIDISPQAAEECLRETGICFLFAQTYHPAMKHVAPIRRALGIRTIFNLLGPLCNPAGVRRQLVGVFDAEIVETVALALARLGSERAWVVHGEDGLDELSTTGKSLVASLDGGHVELCNVNPGMLGLPLASVAQLQGGNAQANATAIRDLFAGTTGAFRDIVILNSAGALVVAGAAASLRDASEIAAATLDRGAAARTLDQFISATRDLAT